MEIEQVRFEVACGHLNAVAAGPENGPAVVLLHGFPEFWYSWRGQIEPLAKAGFRVIAPDQRGYNRSSKLRNVSDYAPPKLTADVLAIADQIGRESICLAGHGWGASVAWNAAILFPKRIAKLAILNVPHPAVMQRFLTTNPRQLLRSWYMLFFQIPILPEMMFSAGNYHGGIHALVGSSRPGTFSAEDLERYLEAWRQPGALTAMIDWYRGLIRTVPDRRAQGRVTVPTRILWGMKDRFLLPEMAAESLKYCDKGELFEFPGTSHWISSGHGFVTYRIESLQRQFCEGVSRRIAALNNH